MNNAIYIRDLLPYSTEELHCSLNGVFYIVDDDGKAYKNSYQHAILSAYSLNAIKAVGDVHIDSRFVFSTYQKDNGFNIKNFISMLESCILYVRDSYKNKMDPYELNEKLSLAFAKTINDCYNDHVKFLSEYIPTFSLDDLLELNAHPTIRGIADPVLSQALPKDADMHEMFENVKKSIPKLDDIPNNRIVALTRAGNVKTQQLAQCLACRGHITDWNGSKFESPVKASFISGLMDPAEFGKESRSASTALNSNTAAIEQSEYFARRLQINNMSVARIHIGDCGSTDYILYHVGSKKDLSHILGVYYKLSDEHDEKYSKNVKSIKGDELYLIGKTIKIRNVIAGCKHPDPHGYCTTCLGESFEYLPKNTNLGHAGTTESTKRESQLILSTKHFISGVVEIKSIYIQPYMREFLTTNGEMSYFINNKLKHKNYFIIINRNESSQLAELMSLSDKDLNNINIFNFSHITNITIELHKSGVLIEQKLDVSDNNRTAALTKEFIRYIAQQGIRINSRNDYVIDMSNWDTNLKILSLPHIQESMFDFQRKVEQAIESSMLKMNDLNAVSPVERLMETLNLLTQRLDVTLPTVTVSMLGNFVRSQNDLSLPKSGDIGMLIPSSLNMISGSLGMAMALERHVNILTMPQSFTATKRPDNVFDPMLVPTIFNLPENREYS